MTFKCKECDKIFNSKLGLGNHISKNYNIKNYYDKWIKSNNEDICKICGEKNKFRGLRDGYTKTCMSCSKKIRFPSNREYWIYRGHTIKDAKNKVIDFQKNQNKKIKNHKNDANIEYYIGMGYSKIDAINKIKERQTTFSKEICIQKYGIEKGLKIWNERQEKWKKTMDNKPEEEKIRINKLKGITLENMIRKYGPIDGAEKYNDWKLSRKPTVKSISKISQELFFQILEKINDKNIKFGKHGKEFYIKTKSGIYFYDFRCNKKIIEFNGDIFHANPKIYSENDFPNFYNPNLSARDIWIMDKKKLKVLEEFGFNYLIIWESDYKNDPDKILKECLEFLNNE